MGRLPGEDCGGQAVSAPDPWQVITDLAGILYRGGQADGDVRRAALGVLWNAGITAGGMAAQEPEPAPEPAAVVLAEVLDFLGGGIPPGDEFALQVAQWRERGLPS
jgi:hypothetical protein